jgi:2-dehydro-3-deoxygluconokinase
MKNEVITIGESLVAFIPNSHMKLRYVDSFTKVVVGAELNVAVGLSKLGHRSGWISKLGNDEFGAFVLRELRAEGVDTGEVSICDNLPTAIMFKQFSNDEESSVFYYRSNSAASTLSVDDIDWELLKKTKVLHLSGITPALSETTEALTLELFRFAKKHNILISFDPNIRLKLWDEERALSTLRPLVEQADIVLLGEDEAALLLDESDPNSVCRTLLDFGVRYVAVKMGDKGACVADSEMIVQIDPYPVTVVDTIGAGDAFNAGFLAGLLEGRDIETSGKMGALMGAMAVSSVGDTEGLPERPVFDRLMKHIKEIAR